MSQCLITDWNTREETDHTIEHVEEDKWSGQEARKDNDSVICQSLKLIVCENHNISVLLSICYKTTLSSFLKITATQSSIPNSELSMFLALLFFCCCITNYHECRSLEACKVITSQCVCQHSGTFQLCPLLRVSHRCDQGISRLNLHLEVWLGKDLLPSYLRLLVGLTCLQLCDWSSHCFAMSQLGTSAARGQSLSGPLHIALFIK